MKTIKIQGIWAKGREAIVSDEDYSRLNKFVWKIRNDPKTPYLFYVYAWDHERHIQISMHREVAGDKPGMYVDHINRNTLDNRRENLRHITPRESILNRNNYIIDRRFMGYAKGYSKHGNKYEGHCFFQGKGYYLGSFNTPEEAHQEYINCITKLGE